MTETCDRCRSWKSCAWGVFGILLGWQLLFTFVLVLGPDVSIVAKRCHLEKCIEFLSGCDFVDVNGTIIPEEEPVAWVISQQAIMTCGATKHILQAAIHIMSSTQHLYWELPHIVELLVWNSQASQVTLLSTKNALWRVSELNKNI